MAYCGYEYLWNRVLNQARLDMESKRHWRAVYEWASLDNPDFIEVCDHAGEEPSVVAADIEARAKERIDADEKGVTWKRKYKSDSVTSRQH